MVQDDMAAPGFVCSSHRPLAGRPGRFQADRRTGKESAANLKSA